MKIALVHDYLVQYGGAERVLEAFSEIWPAAPIYTLVHDENLVHKKFNKQEIRTSFLQKIPFAKKHHRIFPPLMMLAVEQFNLDYYDIVLSDSSSFAKNIITGPNTLHISYCHTPMRYGWDDCQYYTQEYSFPSIVKKVSPFLMNYIRMWDWQATNGVDKFIANSKFVQGRIKKYYNRKSVVINPPVDIGSFYISPPSEVGNYFLLVGRMMKYKKMNVVIEAFNKMRLPLKVVGRGVEFKNLQKIAGPTIEFLGRVSDQELKEIYSQTQGFVFPQEEDFGIVAIEALASGRPVIAYQAGDVEENIEDGKTGIFFKEQTEDSIIKAIRKFQKIEFDARYIKQQAKRFNKETFKKNIKQAVEQSLGTNHQSRINTHK
jgi:glycosyltransferase involved in cell wall biosynthesis